ncbi:phage tail tape measure protein [Fusobacterium periodonticum]|uniref:Phage tail tape measure protein n=2 Tax=Fusobacterium periodonticum TaxID=860 RepID=A0AAD0HVX2_9FUSO|nr:phage tail tape measure protein [Fusobacterium periodonticum]AVQ26004.1 phage tail tape measure protein [Fusobacterium periodonticum]KGE61602.1 phage tail tape measure protein, TP901 family, core region [Fusobacterium periodonticum 2_1_31]
MAKDMSLIWQMGVAGANETMAILSKAAKSLNEVKDSTEDLVKTQKKLEGLDKVAEAYKNANSEYNKAAKNLEQLRKAYAKSNNVTAEFKEQVKNAEKQVDKLNKQKERQKHVFEAARSALENEGIKLEGYKKKLKEVNEDLKKQEKLKKDLSKAQAISDIGDQFSKKGSEQLRRGAATGAALAIPVKFYMDVEESQADLRKILGKEAEKYYDDLAELSKNGPLSQIEINEIAGSLAQSGIKGEDIVAYSDMAGKMKVAFDISTDEAGTFLAKTKEQLNLSKDELFSYMDTLNMLSNNYSVTAAQLADVSARTGGFAKSINLSKESNMAFATSLISTGVTAEQTSTVLGKLYSELSQGANTKNKAAALQRLGFDPGTINKEMAENAEGTILKVLEKIKNSNVADKSALISDIFGSDKSVINGLSVLSENLDGVKEKLDKAKQAVSENEKVNGEYEDRLNTLTNQLKIFRNNAFNALADIGKSIAPELKETLNTLKEFAGKIANFIKENPKLVAFIVKMVAGFAAMNLGMGVANKLLLGPFAKGVGWLYKFGAFKSKGGVFFALKKMFPLASKLFGTFVKIGTFIGGKFIGIIKMVGLALKAAFVANPVGLIIAAIVAVIAIFVLLYKKCEWFRKGVDKAWKAIKEGFKATWTWIKNKFHALMELGAKVWAKIKEYKALFIPFIGIFVVLYQKCEWFRNGVNAVWKAIKNAFSNTWQWIKDKFNALLEIGSNAWNGLKNSATVIIDKIREAFSGFFDWINKKWESLKNLGSKLNPFNWFKGEGEVAQNYSGTNYFGGGLTTLAERGAELVEMNNSSYLVNSPVMANLPRGARILNNSQTRSSLSSRVSSLKDRIRSISNDSRTVVGGDTITININGGSGSDTDIARAVKRVIEEIQSKKRRTAII